MPLKDNNESKYNDIKIRIREKYLSSGIYFAHQVVVSRTYTKVKKSLCSNLIMQIVAKSGGILWTVNVPTEVSQKPTMIIGINSGPVKGKGSTAFGFVATTDPKFSKYYSKVYFGNKVDFVSTQLKQLFLNAMIHFGKVNNVTTPRVIIYRDGVGDGDIEKMKEDEVKQILELYVENGFKPDITYIAVNKKTTTRFFETSNSNPTPGTVVDTIVVPNPEMNVKIDVTNSKDGKVSTQSGMAYEFFLISQQVQNEASASPVRYHVIFDTNQIGSSPENHRQVIQNLTYKMSYMYYNWTGTIKSPSPCQYALKIAKLYGQHIQQEMVEISTSKLHYL